MKRMQTLSTGGILLLSMRPWHTPEKNLDIDRTITVGFILFTLFMLIYSISVGGEVENVLNQQFTTVFILFLLIISYFSIGSSLYAGFGTTSNAARGILIGTLVGLISLSLSLLKLSTPLSSSLSTSTVLSGVYIALVIPFVEEKFFGRILPYVVNRTLKNSFATLVAVSIIFGLFHVFAYRADILLMFSAMVFRGCVIIGNDILKTSMFGDTLHYLNNIVYVVSKFR